MSMNFKALCDIFAEITLPGLQQERRTFWLKKMYHGWPWRLGLQESPGCTQSYQATNASLSGCAWAYCTNSNPFLAWEGLMISDFIHHHGRLSVAFLWKVLLDICSNPCHIMLCQVLTVRSTQSKLHSMSMLYSCSEKERWAVLKVSPVIFSMPSSSLLSTIYPR